MDNLTRRGAIGRAAARLAALAAALAALPATPPAAPAAHREIGKCKRPGCKCPGYEGGFICSNCGHSNADHI